MGGHGICTAAAAPVEEEPPSPPRLGELTASHVSPDSVQLEWSVPAGSFDSFTVQYKDAQGQPQVVPVDGGSRSVTVPGLSPSRRYKFNLYGVWGRKRLGPVSTDAITGEDAVCFIHVLRLTVELAYGRKRLRPLLLTVILAEKQTFRLQWEVCRDECLQDWRKD